MQYINEIPLIWDEEADKNLFGSLFQGGLQPPTLTGNLSIDPLAHMRTNKSFDEVSNEIALQTLFGKDSVFYTENDGELITRYINKKLLAEEIIKFSLSKSKMKYNRFYFNHGEDGFSDFEIDNKPYNVDTQINTLSGEIDFAKMPKFKFLFNLERQEAKYKIYYEFTKFKNSEEHNRYAIILTFNKYIDFEAFINKVGKEIYDKTKDNIKIEFNKAFTIAKGKSEVLDFLYETAPNFVLIDRKDQDLYNDLLLLSGKQIDTLQTNENIAILNLLEAIKDNNWFKNKVNENPDCVRLLFENFSRNSINNLIQVFIKIGLYSWDEVELENALLYSLNSTDDDFDEDNFIDSRVAYWCGYVEKEKTFEVGYSIHQYDKSNIPIHTSPQTQGYIVAFSPLKIVTDKDTYFIPAFVAEYFTNKQLEEDKMIVLDTISSMLLPEATLAKVKPFLKVKIPKVRFLKLKPSWLPERIIATKSKKTVTLLGNYIKDTKNVLTELNYPKSINFSAKEGEFNLLNVPDEKIKNFSTFWEDFNQPWLKQATDRGDEIVILSDKFSQDLLYKSSGEITGFGKEIEFMDNLVKEGVYKFIKEEGKYIKTKK